MANVIVAENEFFSTAVPDTLYHWGVVASIGVDLTTYNRKKKRKWEWDKFQSLCEWFHVKYDYRMLYMTVHVYTLAVM